MPYGFFILFFTLILFKEDVSLSIYYVYSMLIFFVTYCFYMYFFDLFICRINQKKIILPLWLSTAQGVALSVACYGIVAQMRCMQHVCWGLLDAPGTNLHVLIAASTVFHASNC
ncbi:MAG: hypothetical protein AMJ60_00435 [Desulfobacterales bacterium SG8_35]|nr:MAG: hypothetical protein AMJ60_00435 [Desulfobacterales bacterium SG8_35]